MLLTYSKVAYFIAGIEIIMRILTIIIIVIYKSDFLEDCKNSIDNISSRIEYSGDACNQGYVFSLTFAIAFGIVVILMSVCIVYTVLVYLNEEKLFTKYFFLNACSCILLWWFQLMHIKGKRKKMLKLMVIYPELHMVKLMMSYKWQCR